MGYENSDVALFMLERKELVEGVTSQESLSTTPALSDCGVMSLNSALVLSTGCFGVYQFILICLQSTPTVFVIGVELCSQLCTGH